MAETVLRGPLVNIGSVLDGRAELFDGPGLEYQATGFPDIRFPNVNTTGISRGRVRALLNSPFAVMCDNVPQAAAAAGLAAAQAVVPPAPLTLLATGQANGTAPGVPTASPGLSIYRADTGALVTGLYGLDFGFTTGTTTVGSTTLPVVDGTLFAVGQWIAVGGAGNAAKTLPLYTQVLSIVGNNLFLRDVPVAAITNAPIGSALPPVPTGASSAGIFPVAVYPFVAGGLSAFLNPPEALARCVSVTGTAGAAAQLVAVRGYDVFNFPLTETINFAGGVSTAYGKKAFKYVASITPPTAGGTISAGWGDTFGLHVRSDKWEYTNLFYNGTFLTTSAGWLAGDKTNPATGITGDVRGTLQVSTNGAGTAIAAPAATNGVIRLMIATTVPLYNNLAGTPSNAAPMYGVTQFAG